ncbi:unnamed protein product [Phytophthora fragariaefolia]|uniref:Unnamed protein product n=1 Tax=Phytophthora fragariaefolia TaxID=1490495 RepID=A0A9W6WRZ2_9STRA|nr:unnamed protein product [Phytophthora fragariaefolia]
MLHYAGLDKTFWAEAAMTAIYIKNRLPSPKSPDKTPFEIVYKSNPNVKHLERSSDNLNEEQPKYPVYPRSFRPLHQAPGTCQVRHAGGHGASPSDDFCSLWSQKSRSFDRANRSQDPDPTAVINDECAATKSSTWCSSIQEPSHSENSSRGDR